MNGTPRRPILILPPLLLLVTFLSTSFYGLDFGSHWDEDVAKFESVKGSVDTGLFLQAATTPNGYIYGGVNYILTWIGFTPEVVTYLVKGPLTREGLSAAITPLNFTRRVRLRVRGLYILVSSFSIFWLYRLSLVLGRSRTEAFIAAAALSGSWEVAYHSRWMAPDTVMMQFCLLSFLCLAIGVTSKQIKWFYFSAIAVGATIGTKYPGVLILPFVLAGSAYSVWQERRAVRPVLKHLAGVFGTASLTFVITTPGVVLDPFRFLDELKLLQGLYATNWYGYTVKPGLRHFYGMLTYFTLQLFSHYWFVSISLALFCLLGIVAMLWERRGLTMLALGFVAAYLAYFSLQGAMIVRNLLVVAPFLCLAVARGVVVLADRLGPRGRMALYGCCGALLVVNLSWEAYAAHTIAKRHDLQYFLTQFEAYADRSHGSTFLVSSQLATALKEVQPNLPSNVVSAPGVAYDKAAFFQTESADKFWAPWPSNGWGLYETSFGPLEVNLAAYPTFVGNQRIIVVSRAHFKRLPIKVSDLVAP